VQAPSTQDDLKRIAALVAIDLVQEGMLVGLGTGSTADAWIRALGQRVQSGLTVSCVPTSRRTEHLAREVGLPLARLEDHGRLDLTVDGADEIDPRTLALIKGRGGALLREKLVAAASRRVVIVADESKLVPALGCGPIPVEIIRFGWRQTAVSLEELGCQPILRLVEGAPFVSDEGHYIVDCHFPAVPDPAALAGQIKALIGVVEHGLFIALADQAIVAGLEGVQVIDAPPRPDGQASRAKT
jgi:ribose 5-phosphate isomerase A